MITLKYDNSEIMTLSHIIEELGIDVKPVSISQLGKPKNICVSRPNLWG